MKIRDCMKRDVVSVAVSAKLSDAVARLVQRHVGTLPVVDDTGRLLGILTLHNVLGLVMPDFVRLMEDFEFVSDFGAVEDRLPSPEALARPVREVMQPPVAVRESSGILRAFAVLRQHALEDLPVVAPDGRLVGIASPVDMGTTLLAGWRVSEERQ